MPDVLYVGLQDGDKIMIVASKGGAPSHPAWFLNLRDDPTVDVQVAADKDDPRRDDLKVQPQLYNLDCVAYESLMLGLFTIFRGERPEREKPNDVCIGYSRDGFHWSRPDREAFLPVSEQVGDWNWANVQSASAANTALLR